MYSAEWQVMCTFKALHNDPQQQQQHLSKEEFRRLYEMRNLNWKAVSYSLKILFKEFNDVHNILNNTG